MDTGRREGQNVGGRDELNGGRNGASLDGTVMLDSRHPGWRCH